MALTKRDVEDMIRSHAHVNQSRETAPLDRSTVGRILETMTTRMHTKAGFGVTLTEDHNGAWGGQVGQRLLTLRFGDGKDHFTVSMVIKEISSYAADEHNHALKIEDK